MKTAKDPRHIQRIKTMQALFAWEFNRNKEEIKSDPNPDNTNNQESGRVSIDHITPNLEQIDGFLQQAAPAWPIDNINKIDLAILRQAIFELMVEKKTPPKVVVDEAVELAKSYGSESSASFINGALGKLIAMHKVN